VPGPEVFCIGETMALVVPVLPLPLREAELFRVDVGGAESTVAMYLAGLGHRSAWVSRVGQDPLGQRVVGTIASHGVDTTWVRVDPLAPTGVYFKDPGPHRTTVFYYRRGSAASRMSPDDLEDVPLGTSRVVHLSGITPGLSASCRDLVTGVVERTRSPGTLVSFDVNYRPGLWSVEDAAPVLADIASRCDIAFVGQDEAHLLWGTGTPEQVARLLGERPRVVVKDAAVGASDLHGGRVTFAAAHEVEVVEAVGAGDAFAAGYLSGVLRGLAPDRRLDLGHRLAARALSSTSDFVPSG